MFDWHYTPVNVLNHGTTVVDVIPSGFGRFPSGIGQIFKNWPPESTFPINFSEKANTFFYAQIDKVDLANT